MASRKRSTASSKGGPSNTGCLLWLIVLVAILILFLVNIGKIRATLESTNFREVVKTQREKEPDKPQPVPSAPKVEDELPAAPSDKPAAEKPTPEPQSGTGSTAPAEQPAAAKPEPVQKPAAQKPAAEKPAAGSAAGSATAPAAAKPVPTRQAQLFFVRIDDDGIIVRVEVKRAVPASDSPLSDSLGALLKGPTEDELRRKLISLVPAGTRLLGAQVRGSTAFLNFSEEFMYNHYGIEGYAGQLKQIVYTATAFPTVQDVQILIEGERHDYLGGEGVYIGRPLSRNSF